MARSLSFYPLGVLLALAAPVLSAQVKLSAATHVLENGKRLTDIRVTQLSSGNRKLIWTVEGTIPGAEFESPDNEPERKMFIAPIVKKPEVFTIRVEEADNSEHFAELQIHALPAVKVDQSCCSVS